MSGSRVSSKAGRTRARFRVFGQLDRGGNTTGTVTIDRQSGVFSVRALRRRREYVLPLSTVAEIVVSKVLKAELAERRARTQARRAYRGASR